jgi:hypothetical protein
MSVRIVRTLLAPSPALLADRVRVVLGEFQLEDPYIHLAWPLDGYDAVAGEFVQQTEGRHAWHDSERDIGSGSQVPFLVVVWATDHAGRRTVRVAAGHRRMPMGPAPVESIDDLDLPPVAVVFGEHAYFASVPGQRGRRVMLACPCGVLGDLGEIAWMGDRCGPCHDRTEAGADRPPLQVREYRRLRDGDSGEGEWWSPGQPLAIAPDGTVAVAGWSGPGTSGPGRNEIGLWDPGSELVRSRWRTPGIPWTAHFSGDGRTLGIFMQRNGRVHVGSYDPVTEQCHHVHRLADHPQGHPLYLLPAHAFSPDGATFYVRGSTGLLRLHFARGEMTPFSNSHEPPDPKLLACSPDGTMLAALSETGDLALLDAASGAVLRRVRVHAGWLAVGLAFSPDGRYLLVADPPTTVTIFAVADLAELGTLSAGNHDVRGIQVHGHWLVFFHAAPHAITRWPLAPLLDLARRQEKRT